ncbi:MAG: HRDC domain-containing protein, partial [Muribaculaceae bacterium]|nr:HRDC domain-containing protein [Muribaculaceae bacterium]
FYSEYTSPRRTYQRAEPTVDNRTPQEKLTDGLKRLRAQLAAEENIADYMVFSDVTIKALAERMPLMPADLIGIEGLSLVKLAKYYKPILVRVREAKGMKRTLPNGISDLATLALFRQGLDVDTIAGMRGMAVSTITRHLCRAYADGEKIDLWQIVPQELYHTVCGLIDSYVSSHQGQPAETTEEKIENGRNLQEYLSINYGISQDIYSKVRSMRQVLEAAENE